MAERTKRAGLTSLSVFAQTGIGVFLSLFLTPLIVNGLGLPSYGGWLFLLQLTGYLSLGDIFPGGILKLTLATQQHHSNDALKRRQVGTVILTALLSSPLYLIGGGILVWTLPRLIQLSAESVPEARWATGLIVSGMFLAKFLALPGTILRGVNLDYKAIPIRSGVSLLAGLLDVSVVLMGWGIVGLAVNKLFVLILQSTILTIVARREVSWFGVELPSRDEFHLMFRQGLWIFGSQWGTNLSENTDLFLIGILLGPATVAIYSLTGSLAGMATSTLGAVLQSGNPGMGDLVGRGQLDTLRQVRLQLELITLGSFGVIGSVVLVGNRGFVSLWVGPDKYAGHVVNLLLILVCMVRIFTQTQQNTLFSFLMLKEITWLQAISGVVAFAAAFILASSNGLVGLLLGLLIGRIPTLVGYAVYLIRTLRQTLSEYFFPLSRMALVVGGVLIASFAAAEFVRPYDWGGLAMISGITALGSGMAIWLLGLTPNQKSALLLRANAVYQSVKPEHHTGI